MAPRTRIVAIVEDDASMRKGIERLLWAHGCETETYASAEAYLENAAASKATCLVLDIHLGGMSGLELRRSLAARGSKVDVIFMTAADTDETRREAIASGCLAYLRKPFPANLLIAEIDKMAS